MLNLKKKKRQNKRNQKNPELIDIENRLAVASGRGCGMDETVQGGQKVQTYSYKIRKSWDVLYSMMTTLNNTLLHMCMWMKS